MQKYKSENVQLDYLSELRPEEAESIIGKTVSKIIGSEYSLLIEFSDGSTVECVGSNYEGCALNVHVEDGK